MHLHLTKGMIIKLKTIKSSREICISVSMRDVGLPDLCLLADLHQTIAGTVTLHQSEEKWMVVMLKNPFLVTQEHKCL